MSPKARPTIALVNMPFSAVASPAIGLTQLKSTLEHDFPGQFEIEIHYLNHEFHQFINDPEFYSHVMSNFGFATGLGDWLFRQEVFPDAADNTEVYLETYYPDLTPSSQEIRSAVSRLRPQLDGFLREVIERHALDQVDLVGFTTIFSQSMPSFALAKKLKERNPEIPIVVGGSCCTGAAGMEFVRHIDAIDYVFSGPSLVSFPKFISHWAIDDRDSCDQIDGVFSKSNQSRWPQSENADPPGEDAIGLYGPEKDINEAAPPNYDSFLDSFEGFFGGTGLQPRILFETSRGCWWGEKSHCSFCGLNGAFIGYHSMAPEKAINYIQSVLRYSNRCKFFASTDNIMPENFVEEVVPHLDVPKDVTIQYEVRVNLTEDQIAALSKAKVTVIQPGIEALSSATLKLMKKGTSAFTNIRFLKACSKHPVFVGYSLLAFSPKESEDTYDRYLEILPSLAHLPPPLAVYPIEYVRYSPYFDSAREQGLDLRPEPYYGLTYPLPRESIWQIAQKFRDHNADPENIRRWLDLLNDAVSYWQSRWYNRDDEAQARLCLATDGHETAVYDSRSGKEVEYPLTPDLQKVLATLETPLFPSALAADPELAGIDITESIAFFSERNLLFEVNGRFMSLVVI